MRLFRGLGGGAGGRRERHQLLQFEGAMALTNLAGMNEDLRQKIRREKVARRPGLPGTWVHGLLLCCGDPHP